MGFLPINLNGVEEAKGFDYPPGKYLFQVESTEQRANSDGETQRLLVSLVILMGPGPGNVQFQGRKLATSYQLTDKGAPFLLRFLIACGITKEMIAQNGGSPDPDWLPGRQLVATVATKNGYTNVTGEKPATEFQTAAPAAQAAPQAGAPAPAMLQPMPQAAPAPMPMAAPAAAPVPMAASAGYAPQAVPQAAPVALPTPQMPAAAPAAPAAPAAVGIPTPVPPPGNVGQQ